MFHAICFDLLQCIAIDKLVDIDVSGSHVACQMSFYRTLIKSTLFGNLLHRITLVIKPIRTFKSIQFFAGLIAEFLFFLLFRFIGNGSGFILQAVIATPRSSSSI